MTRALKSRMTQTLTDQRERRLVMKHRLEMDHTDLFLTTEGYSF